MSLAALILTSAFAALLPTVPVAPELERFQGTWRVVREHRSKQDMTGVKGKWIVSGDHLTTEFIGEGKGTFKFDAELNPHRFTKTFDKSSGGLTIKGTYRLDGDILTFYTAVSTRFPEPEDLPVDPLPGYKLEKWKRVGKANGEGLNGEWKLSERLASIKRPMYVNDLTMRIHDGRWSWISRGKGEYTIKVDGKNKFLDVIHKASGSRSRSGLVVFE